MKTLLCSLLILLGVPAFGATVKYYDDTPNNPNPGTNYIISLQTGDKSIGGTPYNFWNLGQMVAWLQLRGLTNGGTSISIITNNILYSTNIITTNLFAVYENITYATNVNLTVTSNANFNNSYTTNLTIVVPGGATNLNLTPKTVMWSDANDAQGSIPNASGVFTNNGTGGIGWSSTFSLTELDALNAYLTNTFLIGLTNKLLSTDGNGQATNAVIGAGLTFTGNQLVATGVSSLADATNETTRAINSSTNIYSSLGTAISDIHLGTNVTYKYTTNIVGAANFVFGKAYWTNITADITCPALTMQDNAAMETVSIWITNSAAATHTFTIPGVAGAPGHVVPALFYCTNAAVTRIDIAHFGVLYTNAVVGAN